MGQSERELRILATALIGQVDEASWSELDVVIGRVWSGEHEAISRLRVLLTSTSGRQVPAHVDLGDPAWAQRLAVALAERRGGPEDVDDIATGPTTLIPDYEALAKDLRELGE